MFRKTSLLMVLSVFMFSFFASPVYAKGLNIGRLFSMFTEKTCEEGNVKDCSKKALESLSRKDNQQAFEYLLKACELDAVDACFFIGNAYLQGFGTTMNVEKGIFYIEKSLSYAKQKCEAKNDKYCAGIGDMYFFKDDIEQSLIYYKKGCYLNNANSCSSLFTIYMRDEYKNNDLALKYGQKSCDLNELDICFQLGSSYILGLNDVKDLEKAAFYIEKSLSYAEQQCDANDVFYCAVLGDYNSVITHSYSQALKYYEKACNLDNANACGSAATYYLVDDNKNIDLAKTYAQKGCDGDSYLACYVLGYMHKKGFLPADDRKMQIYFDKACNLNKKFCEDLKQ